MGNSQAAILAAIVKGTTDGTDGGVPRVQRVAELPCLGSFVCADRAWPVETVEDIIGFVQIKPDWLRAA